MIDLRHALPVLCALLACREPAAAEHDAGQRRLAGPETAPEAPAVPRPVTPGDRIAAIARLLGHPANDAWVADRAARLATDPDAYAALVDELLDEPRFGREVVPSLLLGAFVAVRDYYALPSGFVLKQSTRDGPTVFYLRAPCSPAEAVAVAPWWDLGGTILLCPDSYRPTKWTVELGEHAYRSRMPLTCDSQVGSPELENQPLCGCGPNAIRCVRDGEQWEMMNRSLRDEVRRTTEWNVESRRPVSELFTSNETFRDRWAELYYRRQEIGALENADVPKALAGLDAWPKDGQRAPRRELFPGQHAGLLTTPQILHWLPDRRQRQRGFDEILWCAHRNSFGATTQRILDLNQNGNLAFVHDSWDTLAHTPLCTNCHARLDYGFQFFYAYPDSRASTFAVPGLRRAGRGPMYVKDIDDSRGEGELTPAGFAAMATAQPEFEDCVTQQVVGYVLGSEAGADDVAAVRAAVAGGHGSIHDIMRAALLRLAVQAPVSAAPAIGEPASPAPAVPEVPAVVDPGAPAAPASIALGERLRTVLDDTCVGCHDEVPFDDQPDSLGQPFDLRGEALPRRLLIRALERVAFHQMPPKGMPAAARRALVEGLIGRLWQDAKARDEARSYFVVRGRGLPAQLIDEALNGVQAEIGQVSSLSWGEIERAIWTEQNSITPGYLATVALETLRSCKGGKGARLDACLAKRFVPAHLVRSPPAVTASSSR